MASKKRCACCGDPIARGISPSSVAIKIGGDGLPARTTESWKLCAECVVAIAAAVKALLDLGRAVTG